MFETIQILQSLIEAGKGMGDKDVKLYVRTQYLRDFESSKTPTSLNL